MRYMEGRSPSKTCRVPAAMIGIHACPRALPCESDYRCPFHKLRNVRCCMCRAFSIETSKTDPTNLATENMKDREDYVMDSLATAPGVTLHGRTHVTFRITRAHCALPTCTCATMVAHLIQRSYVDTARASLSGRFSSILGKQPEYP